MSMRCIGSSLVLGALLCVAEALLLGSLSAMTVPPAYFAFFGTHALLASTLEEAVLVALPTGLLALGWGLASTRLIRGLPLRVAAWVVAGLIGAWIAWLVQDLPWSFLVPPVRGVLASVSAPAGVLIAGLIARSVLPHPSTAVRYRRMTA